MDILENMTEEQALSMLFEQTKELPQRKVQIDRIGLEMTIQAFPASEIDRIHEQCTFKQGRGRNEKEIFDGEMFSALIVARATTELKINGATISGGWGNKTLLGKFSTSGPETVVRKVFLGGELDAIVDQVLKLSGYYLNLDDIKNS